VCRTFEITYVYEGLYGELKYYLISFLTLTLDGVYGHLQALAAPFSRKELMVAIG
jgi:hypothetical protein